MNKTQRKDDEIDFSGLASAINAGLSDPPAENISSAALATMTGLSDRRHRQLAKDGWFPPPSRGAYQRDVTFKGLFKYFKERSSGTKCLKDLKLRKEKDAEMPEATERY